MTPLPRKMHVKAMTHSMVMAELLYYQSRLKDGIDMCLYFNLQYNDKSYEININMILNNVLPPISFNINSLIWFLSLWFTKNFT